MINKESEEKLRQLFKEESDFYDLNGNAIIEYLSEDCFIRIMEKSLSLFNVSESIANLNEYGKITQLQEADELKNPCDFCKFTFDDDAKHCLECRDKLKDNEYFR